MPPPLCTAPPSPATVPPAFPPPEHPTAVGWGHRIPSVALGWQWALRMGMGGGGRMFSMGSPPPEICCPHLGRGEGGWLCMLRVWGNCFVSGEGATVAVPPPTPSWSLLGRGGPQPAKATCCALLGGGGGGGRAEVGSQGGGLGSCRPPPHPPPRLGAERVLAVPPPRCRPRKRFALCPPPPEQDQSPPKPPPLPPRPVPPSGLANYGALRSGFTLV